MRQPNLLGIIGSGREFARDDGTGRIEETKVVGPWRGEGEREGGGEKTELGGR